MNRYSLLLLIGILPGTALHGQSAGITATTEYPSAPVNNVANYPGADLCAKVNAAVAALGAGAIIDARGFTGSQSCSANVIFKTSNQTLLLSGNLNWQLGAYNISHTGDVGGIRLIGGGRPIGMAGQRPGCAKSPILGAGTCLFSSASAVVQFGDGMNKWDMSKEMNPATGDLISDLTVIQTGASGDGFRLISTFEAELFNVGAWNTSGASTGAAFHEFGVTSVNDTQTCAWEWGTKVYNPNFGGFLRGWYEDGPTSTGNCLKQEGTGTGGNNQFFGGFIGTANKGGKSIGIDWAAAVSTNNWVFGTDVETSDIGLHIVSNDNRFYGRLEGSNCKISVQLDGIAKGAQNNEIAGVYLHKAISIVNGPNFDNNLFWAPYTAWLGPTGDFSIFSMSDAPQTIRFGSGSTKNQTTALQLGTNASGSFVPWAQFVMNMTDPKSGLAIRDRSGANRFVWWGSNTNLAGTNGGGILINADKDSGTAGLSVFSGGSEPVRWSQLTNGLMLSGDPPKVSNGEIGFGAKTAPASSCGSLPGASGCIAVNIGGSLHYIPYW